MSERRIVPVAYVTQWATTQGITVIKQAEEVSGDDYTDRYLTKRYASRLWVGSSHWTEDREVAIQRWRKEMEKAKASALKKAKKIEAALAGEPPFTEG
jgi:diphthamide biosynthesis methyltransferase